VDIVLEFLVWYLGGYLRRNDANPHANIGVFGKLMGHKPIFERSFSSFCPSDVHRFHEEAIFALLRYGNLR
jgi:hypothetical protein